MVRSYDEINRRDLSSLAQSSNSSNAENYPRTCALIARIRELHKPLYYARKDEVSCTSVAIMGHVVMLAAKLASNDRLLCVARQIYVVGLVVTTAYVTRLWMFYPRGENEMMNRQQAAAEVVLNTLNRYKQMDAAPGVLDQYGQIGD